MQLSQKEIISKNYRVAFLFCCVSCFLLIINPTNSTSNSLIKNNLETTVLSVNKKETIKVEGFVMTSQEDSGLLQGQGQKIVEIKAKHGTFLLVDLKLKKTDGNQIGVLTPYVIDDQGKKYPCMLMANVEDEIFSGSMIVDGELQNTTIKPAIYKPESSFRLCFDVVRTSQYYDLTLSNNMQAIRLPLTEKPQDESHSEVEQENKTGKFQELIAAFK